MGQDSDKTLCTYHMLLMQISQDPRFNALPEKRCRQLFNEYHSTLKDLQTAARLEAQLNASSLAAQALNAGIHFFCTDCAQEFLVSDVASIALQTAAMAAHMSCMSYMKLHVCDVKDG